MNHNSTHIQAIEAAWGNHSLLKEPATQNAIREVIYDLDTGKTRIAMPTNSGWQINEWAKKAISLYFMIQEMQVLEVGPCTYYDKIPLKQNFKELNVRVVPPAVARYGTCLREGAILMASYVNIGAYIDSNTMAFLYFE